MKSEVNSCNAEPRILYCYECHKLFEFSLGEQAFYKRKKLKTPEHCPACRAKRKMRFSDPYYGWEGTMGAPSHAKTGHARVHYAPYIVGGMRG